MGRGQGNGFRIGFRKRQHEETGGLCFYLRDCNNNHTSATGLVASIILSTVEQKCMRVKTIFVCVCVCARLKGQNDELKEECTVVECVFTYSSRSHALPQTGNTPLPLFECVHRLPRRKCEDTYICVCLRLI